MTFALYIIGFIIFVGGLAYGAHVAGVGPTWILIGVLTLLGIGIFTGAVRTRHKDNAEA
jgi:hypothetical protein